MLSGLRTRCVIPFALLAALLFLPAPAAAHTVSVGEIDITGKIAGDPVTIPVTVAGADPATFAGFQFEIVYDPAALEFVSAGRGALIAMQNAAYAAADYTPYLWGLEAGAEGNAVSVAGLMLMANLGEPPNLALLGQARIGQADGVLVNLNFNLLQKTDTVVRLSAAAGKNLLAFDSFDAAPDTLAQPPGDDVLGGASASGLGIAWQLDYFDGLNNDPAAFSPDGTGFTLLQQFQAGTNPEDPGQTGFLINLVTTAGATNLNFISIPVAGPPLVNGLPVTDAAQLVTALGGSANVGVVYRWNAATQGWQQHIATLPGVNNFTIEPGTALMVSANQAGTAPVTGLAARYAFDLDKPADRPTSLNFIALPYGLNTQPVRAAELVAALGGSAKVGVVYRWNAATQGWQQHIATLPGVNNFEILPGAPLMLSVNQDFTWPVAPDWPGGFPPVVP